MDAFSVVVAADMLATSVVAVIDSDAIMKNMPKLVKTAAAMPVLIFLVSIFPLLIIMEYSFTEFFLRSILAMIYGYMGGILCGGIAVYLSFMFMTKSSR